MDSLLKINNENDSSSHEQNTNHYFKSLVWFLLLFLLFPSFSIGQTISRKDLQEPELDTYIKVLFGLRKMETADQEYAVYGNGTRLRGPGIWSKKGNKYQTTTIKASATFYAPKGYEEDYSQPFQSCISHSMKDYDFSLTPAKFTFTIKEQIQVASGIKIGAPPHGATYWYECKPGTRTVTKRYLLTQESKPITFTYTITCAHKCYQTARTTAMHGTTTSGQHVTVAARGSDADPYAPWRQVHNATVVFDVKKLCKDNNMTEQEMALTLMCAPSLNFFSFSNITCVPDLGSIGYDEWNNVVSKKRALFNFFLYKQFVNDTVPLLEYLRNVGNRRVEMQQYYEDCEKTQKRFERLKDSINLIFPANRPLATYNNASAKRLYTMSEDIRLKAIELELDSVPEGVISERSKFIDHMLNTAILEDTSLFGGVTKIMNEIESTPNKHISQKDYLDLANAASMKGYEDLSYKLLAAYDRSENSGTQTSKAGNDMMALSYSKVLYNLIKKKSDVSIPFYHGSKIYFFNNGQVMTIDNKNKKMVPAVDAPPTGNMLISSNPSGAEVIINGYKTGSTTPYTFAYVKSGDAKIELKKLGYVAVTLDLPDLANTQSEYNIDLSDKFPCKISCNNSKSKIYINGKKLENWQNGTALKPGPYSIKAKAKHYDVLKRDVVIDTIDNVINLEFTESMHHRNSNFALGYGHSIGDRDSWLTGLIEYHHWGVYGRFNLNFYPKVQDTLPGATTPLPQYGAESNLVREVKSGTAGFVVGIVYQPWQYFWINMGVGRSRHFGKMKVSFPNFTLQPQNYLLQDSCYNATNLDLGLNFSIPVKFLAGANLWLGGGITAKVEDFEKAYRTISSGVFTSDRINNGFSYNPYFVVGLSFFTK